MLEKTLFMHVSRDRLSRERRLYRLHRAKVHFSFNHTLSKLVYLRRGIDPAFLCVIVETQLCKLCTLAPVCICVCLIRKGLHVYLFAVIIMSRCMRIIILSCESFLLFSLSNNSRRLPKRSCLWIFITSFSLLMASTYVDSCHDPPQFSPPSAPEWTVSCPRKERCREVLFDIRQIRHLHISSVKCKASKLVSQRQWAAHPFSEMERRLGSSSSLCDHGSMLYVFEIIWIIWFAWLNPDLLNLLEFRRSGLSVCVQLLAHVCVVLLDLFLSIIIRCSHTEAPLTARSPSVVMLWWMHRVRKTAWRTELVGRVRDGGDRPSPTELLASMLMQV